MYRVVHPKSDQSITLLRSFSPARLEGETLGRMLDYLSRFISCQRWVPGCFLFFLGDHHNHFSELAHSAVSPQARDMLEEEGGGEERRGKEQQHIFGEIVKVVVVVVVGCPLSSTDL